eukprot:TRINITY_DN532_c0_g1_i2.p4 TRINITY_DN532_c0_g1~~TRINITY_DN532_c0_g1_i2.p4  ORF type:complete len:141 (-),score=28.14 TRINITY_DN532_c0_g1_i2:69-491(-)
MYIVLHLQSQKMGHQLESLLLLLQFNQDRILFFFAQCSLLLGKKVRPDVAMTGEITLSGLVLPVGGIKEKVLAAYTAGIKKIILPKRNKNDLTDLPQPILEEIDFIFANTIQDVLFNALEKEMFMNNQNANNEQLKQSKL